MLLLRLLRLLTCYNLLPCYSLPPLALLLLLLPLVRLLLALLHWLVPGLVIVVLPACLPADLGPT